MPGMWQQRLKHQVPIDFSRRNKCAFTNNDSDDDSIDEDNINVTNNIVKFHADVNRGNCMQLIECLNKAKEFVSKYNSINEFEEISNIYLYIFSDGGEVYSAFTIIDYILQSKINIITINFFFTIYFYV